MQCCPDVTLYVDLHCTCIVVEFSRTQANFSEHLLSLMTNLLLFVALHMDKKNINKSACVAFAGVDSEKWRPLHCIKR